MDAKCKVCDDTEVIVKVRYDSVWIETPCTECDPFEDEYDNENQICGLSIMPTFEDFYQFLKSYYLHSRFEARNTEGWGSDYSYCVAKSHYEDLERDGVGRICMYESRTATVIKYNQKLEVLNPDEPPGQIQKRAGRLTSILGSGANF